jgi:CRP-like cAMP-binding protein
MTSRLLGPNFEDPLAYLPRKPVQQFGKRRVIYDPQKPTNSLYVVLVGRVKVVTTAQDGMETIGRIVSVEGLFGESALLGAPSRSETAETLEMVTAMAWTRDEIEEQIEREPRLGIALSQYLVRQCIELQDRIQSMATYQTRERVMLALLQLANSLGTPRGAGATQIPALTHQTLSEFVGTSREIVTCHMNRLRQLGLLNYSRKTIDVYTEAMEAALREQGIKLSASTTSYLARSPGLAETRRPGAQRH